MPGVRIGTSGWQLPAAIRTQFEPGPSILSRYASRFNCVEITSSFYRPHRRVTYERWAAAVPPGFRFAVKVPREITHVRRLIDVDEPLERFVDEIAGLGEACEVVLVQLAPSHAFDAPVAARFFGDLTARVGAFVACEPRHASWFTAAAEELLAANGVARAAADPALVPAAAEPAGSARCTYLRLHGSPLVYASAYASAELECRAEQLRAASGPAWCIFDNTKFGAATGDALALQTLLA